MFLRQEFEDKGRQINGAGPCGPERTPNANPLFCLSMDWAPNGHDLRWHEFMEPPTVALLNLGGQRQRAPPIDRHINIIGLFSPERTPHANLSLKYFCLGKDCPHNQSRLETSPYGNESRSPASVAHRFIDRHIHLGALRSRTHPSANPKCCLHRDWGQRPTNK